MTARRSLFAALLVAVALAGCGGDDATTEPVAPTVTGPPASAGESGQRPFVPYPDEVRDTFLEACGAGGSEKECQCSLTYLEVNIPIAEFTEAGLAAAEGGADPDFMEAARDECR